MLVLPLSITINIPKFISEDSNASIHAQRKKTAPAAKKPSTSTATCAAAPLLALAEADAAVLDALALPGTTWLVVLALAVCEVDEDLKVGATCTVVVPYADAALQYCV